MSIKKYLIWSVIFLLGNCVYAWSNDSVASRRSFFVIPHAAYQQETNWAFGVAGGYYFKSNDISRISSVSGSADYTLLNQFIFNLTPKIYLANKKWYFYTNLNFKKYPDTFFGTGNTPNNFKAGYTSRNFAFTVQPQYLLTQHVFVGAVLSFKAERIMADTALENKKEYIFENFGPYGWSPYKQLSAGLIISYDSRDNQFYPQKGLFIKSLFTISDKSWVSDYSLKEFSLDIRQYIPLWANHTLAWQASMSGIFGRSGVPFQLLPTVGGRDVLRGFRQGMYRDNLMTVVQTEYRLPLYKRLKAAVFCSVGDVMNSDSPAVEKLKVAYGAGFRYRLNDARVHLRLDVAGNNYGEKLQFYITATEAF